MNAPVDPAKLAAVSLDDKYTLEKGRVFLTGTQALIRLMMLQRERDLRAGLNTAGYISGYRGSPLGGLDQALWRAKKHLEAHHVKFQPGVNEDLAATAIWGTQQVGMFPGAKYDGVYRHVVRQGPGRRPLRRRLQARATPRAPRKHGGVLVLAGDDHAAKSSTLAHQSEHILKACCIPVLNPSDVQDYLDFGLHGCAMSRYSGCWIGVQVRHRRGRVGRLGRSSIPSACRSKLPDRLRPAAGRPEHPLAGRVPRAGSAAARLEGVRRAGLCARQRARSHRVGFAAGRRRIWASSPPARASATRMQALADLGIDERVARRHRPARLQGRA